MDKSASLNIRTDPALKAKAEAIYHSYGITLTDAVNIFLAKSVMVQGLPFEMRPEKPNKRTLAGLREAEDILAGKTAAKRYSSAKELFADLDAEEE